MNRKILGGEFAIDINAGSELPVKSGLGLFSCGRTALKAIIRHALPEGNRRILIPDYICGSVPETVRDLGADCCFYTVKDDLMPDASVLPEKLEKSDAVLIVNYFGMIPKTGLDALIGSIRDTKENVKIIVDDVQNYYGLEQEMTCDYAFTSFRKWFPVPDGASAVWNDGQKRENLYPDTGNEKEDPPVFSRYKFAGNILKNFRDVTGDEVCLELIEKGEELISDERSDRALQWTIGAMERMNHGIIRDRRRKNAAVLHRGLEKLGIPHLYHEKAIPLFVPVFLGNHRDRVRDALFSHSVFCPVHWGENWKEEFECGRNPLSDRELSLICDQRYDEEDMRFQLEILEKCV